MPKSSLDLSSVSQLANYKAWDAKVNHLAFLGFNMQGENKMDDEDEYNEEYDDDWEPPYEDDEEDDDDRIYQEALDEEDDDGIDHIEAARDFVRTSTDHCHSFYMKNKDRYTRIRYLDYICYMPIKEKYKRTRVEVIGIVRHVKTPLQKQYWNWVTCPNTSPWRHIINRDNLEVVHDDAGDIVGFLLHASTLDNLESKSVMSFLLAQKSEAEFPKNIQFWGHAVDNGLDPTLAYVLAFFFKYSKKISAKTIDNRNHWPIDPTKPYFSFNNFSEGKVRSEAEYISTMFNTCDKHYDWKKPPPSFTPVETKEYGVFSYLQYYNLNGITKDYGEYQKRLGDWKRQLDSANVQKKGI